jgi:hypothetical protein
MDRDLATNQQPALSLSELCLVRYTGGQKGAGAEHTRIVQSLHRMPPNKQARPPKLGGLVVRAHAL